MLQQGWIDTDTQEQARQRWWFGRMIGNNDMHFGNLSFFLSDALPLRLTPNYDMLPMMYRPASSGEVVARDFRPATPASDLAQWRESAALGQLYWRRVARHEEISGGFRQIAEANGEAIFRMRQRFGPEGVS